MSFSLCLLAAAVMAACGGGTSTEEPTVLAESEVAGEDHAAQPMDADPNAVSIDQPVDNFADASNPDPTMRAQSLASGFVDSSAVFIDTSLIPLGSTGSSVDIVRSTTELPVPTEGGAFRTTCRYSHMASDDPIVFPNQPGRSHLHTFFGNTGTNADSTASSLQTSGNSTCRGGTVNRTAYWVPSMIDTRTGAPVKPKDSQFYYKNGHKGIVPSSVRPMPDGLRMIAGDPKNAAPVGPFYYNCKRGSNVKEIPNCSVGADVYQNITFPQCWDGVNLDSPDHKSHMAYHTKGVCPSTHPVILPEVTFRIIYAVTEEDAPLHWRLSSDAYDRSLPAGYSSHGDWFNGWKRDVSHSWATNCIAASKDCHSHLLGDGRKISF
ncbi:DUF1996 domain-containing protein [Piscinibacter sp.]|uniref:DUF1996 domain-containing protein n=1 Tax=Piscinibacter sp. TaxID=1903157 RepID=UPI002BBB38DF|nr:DUF1996 domain-containing protein [Albitalea sp.]HUG23381.1 DUF1996 domain-containing protein [Albitalea sp.]